MAKADEALHKDVILSSAGVTASLVLADPTIFLSGFSKQEQSERPPALVRGSLILKITKAVKIKAISLNFKGISRTDWPEGIPSDKSETHETKEVFAHEWRMFSAQFPKAVNSSGAHVVTSLDSEQKLGGSSTDLDSLHPTTTAQSTPHELVNQHEAVQKGYRVFQPAEYVYNFELMLPQQLPETLKCNFGHVRWGFMLTIERYGTFKPNLVAQKDVTLLRTLGPSNLERSEPIVISRDWEDLLHYDIIIAGKAFAIGQKFNVAFALVPLAKVRCHRIRVYITEHTEYFCRNHRIHRVEPSHKFLLMEKKSPDGSRGDLLTSNGPGLSGLTEFEFNIEIPESFPSRRDHLRPNANTEYIRVYHWIKAVMRLSRQDIMHNGEPKCYEVSIDSPITLVDARTNLANELPDYNTARKRNEIVDALKPYREFIQKQSSSAAVQSGNSSSTNTLASLNTGNSTSNTVPTEADGGAARAILFARKPSVAPPPFDADVRPPELLPPQYDDTKEDFSLYEQRYEKYLLSTGRLPPSALTERLNRLTTDNASDSNSSTLSQSSDNASGSTAHTAAEDMEAEQINPNSAESTAKVPKASGDAPTGASNTPIAVPLATSSAPSAPAASPSPGSSAVPAPREPTASSLSPASAPVPVSSIASSAPVAGEHGSPPKPRKRGSRRASRNDHVPVFSEIIWSEDAAPQYNDTREDMVDPRLPQEGLVQPVINTTESASPRDSSISPSHSSDSPFSGTPHTSLPESKSPKPPHMESNTDSPPLPLQKVRSSPADSAKRAPTTSSGNAETSSSPRPIPKRGSVGRNSAFSPPLSYNQKMRSSIVGSATANQSAGSAFNDRNQLSSSGRRMSSHGPRLSLKTPTPVSVSAGSPLTSPWGQGNNDTNAAQLFGDRWMERRDSTSSTATSPRYFRQSSVVSMDVTRQAALENGTAGPRESIWSSRRPSRVSEIQELRDWNPHSRRNSDTSVAVSIAEYQGLHSDRRATQINAPLLGDEESEMDLGIEWEHDFEDYDMDNDRQSIVSAFYTVMTP